MTKIDLVEELIKAKDYYQIKYNLDFLKRSELLKFEDKVFHKDIENQFEDMLRYKIASDLHMRLNSNFLEVLALLEDINLKELLC